MKDHLFVHLKDVVKHLRDNMIRKDTRPYIRITISRTSVWVVAKSLLVLMDLLGIVGISNTIRKLH